MPDFVEPDSVRTRIISSRQLVCDGAPFQWWAVGDHPSLVTVQSSLFGSLREFTHGDSEAFAMGLAGKLLRHHYARAQLARGPTQEPAEATGPSDRNAMDKAGWFDKQ